jgi:hypothetical protein
MVLHRPVEPATINGVSVNPGNGQFGFAGPAKDIAYNAQLNFVHTFNSNLVLELRAAYTQINNSSNSPNSGTNAATALGFPNNINYGPLDSSGLPLINIPNLAPLGDSNFVPIVDVSNTFEENGTVSYTHGSHSIKFGASLIRRQARNVQSSNGVGNINFGLQEDNGATQQDSINNLATFLAGAFTGEGRNTDLFTPNFHRSSRLPFELRSGDAATAGARPRAKISAIHRRGHFGNSCLVLDGGSAHHLF